MRKGGDVGRERERGREGGRGERGDGREGREGGEGEIEGRGGLLIF